MSMKFGKSQYGCYGREIGQCYSNGTVAILSTDPIDLAAFPQTAAIITVGSAGGDGVFPPLKKSPNRK
jgi:hypothetical protein